jgi:hypothetical protein
MDLKTVHDSILFIVDKEAGSWFPPGEIDRALHIAQLQYFSELYGNPKDLRTAYGLNQSVNVKLAPFKKNAPFTNGDNVNGLLILPSDCMYVNSITVSVYDNTVGALNKPVEFLTEDELAFRLTSSLVPVSESYPVAIEISRSEVQLYPRTAKAGTVYYFKTPDTPNFSYTQVGRVITYSQINSTQLEWDDVSITVIMFKALQILGVNMQSGDLVQYGMAKDEKGS